MDDCILLGLLVDEICVRMRLVARLRDEGAFDRNLICVGCGRIFPVEAADGGPEKPVCPLCGSPAGHLVMPGFDGVRGEWVKVDGDG